jgi:IS30 family transposase
VERRLRREEVMTIEVLRERGVSGRAIARQLGVHENAVRYRLKRLATQARELCAASAPPESCFASTKPKETAARPPASGCRWPVGYPPTSNLQ